MSYLGCFDEKSIYPSSVTCMCWIIDKKSNHHEIGKADNHFWSQKFCKAYAWNALSHCGSVTPYTKIKQFKIGATLAQVMACYLLAPSCYLNQCNYLSSVRSNDLRAVSLEIPQTSITKISFKITSLKFQSNLPGASKFTHSGWVMHIYASVN